MYNDPARQQMQQAFMSALNFNSNVTFDSLSSKLRTSDASENFISVCVLLIKDLVDL